MSVTMSMNLTTNSNHIILPPLPRFSLSVLRFGCSRHLIRSSMRTVEQENKKGWIKIHPFIVGSEGEIRTLDTRIMIPLL